MLFHSGALHNLKASILILTRKKPQWHLVFMETLKLWPKFIPYLVYSTLTRIRIGCRKGGRMLLPCQDLQTSDDVHFTAISGKVLDSWQREPHPLQTVITEHVAMIWTDSRWSRRTACHRSVSQSLPHRACRPKNADNSRLTSGRQRPLKRRDGDTRQAEVDGFFQNHSGVRNRMRRCEKCFVVN